MRDLLAHIGTYLRQCWRFAVTVVKGFRANKGFLLASGVGYNALLSLVPLCIVLLVVLSLFFDQQQIIEVVNAELEFIVPGQADALTEPVTRVVEQRNLFGSLFFLGLLFFSSIAFRSLEHAMEVIFHQPGPDRSFWMSALLPYLFIVAIGGALLALTSLTVVLDALAGRTLELFSYDLTLAPFSGVALYLTSLVGLVLLFTALYKVIPVKTIATRHALVGGILAATLWEVARRVLVWYFANLSVINVVYGSLTTVIVILLIMEIASVIILLGAQVIAELDRNVSAGRPWHGAETSEEPAQTS